MFWKGFKSLGLLGTTLACLIGVSAKALAVPSPKESFLDDAKQVHFVALGESIRAAAASEQPSQFALTSNLEFADTKIADALAPANDNRVSPVTTPPRTQTFEQTQTLDQTKTEQTQTTVFTQSSPSGETRILDRNRSISTEAASLGVVVPDFTATQISNANFRLAQADGTATTPPSAKGPYVSLSGGYQWRQRAGENPVTFTDFKGGYVFNGALGYRFGDFRTDVEASFWNNPVKAVSAAPTGLQSGSGHVTGRAIMFNVYYDIPIRGSRFKPYLGAGIGFYSTRIHNLTNTVLASIPAAFGGPLVVQDSRSNEVFAFQVRAGIAYEFSQNFDVFLGYRYFNGNTLTFTNTVFGTLNPNGDKFNSIELGARILF